MLWAVPIHWKDLPPIWLWRCWSHFIATSFFPTQFCMFATLVVAGKFGIYVWDGKLTRGCSSWVWWTGADLYRDRYAQLKEGKQRLHMFRDFLDSFCYPFWVMLVSGRSFGGYIRVPCNALDSWNLSWFYFIILFWFPSSITNIEQVSQILSGFLKSIFLPSFVHVLLFWHYSSV